MALVNETRLDTDPDSALRSRPQIHFSNMSHSVSLSWTGHIITPCKLQRGRNNDTVNSAHVLILLFIVYFQVHHRSWRQRFTLNKTS